MIERIIDHNSIIFALRKHSSILLKLDDQIFPPVAEIGKKNYQNVSTNVRLCVVIVLVCLLVWL